MNGNEEGFLFFSLLPGKFKKRKQIALLRYLDRILFSVSSRTQVRDLNVFGQISPNVEMTPFFSHGYLCIMPKKLGVIYK